jgi:hypothetical protein
MAPAPDALPFATLLKDFSDLRAFALKLLGGIEERDAMHMPEGFRNHLHWQLGHLLYTQGTTLYEWCGLPTPFRGFAPYFGLGTSPADFDSLVPDWDVLLMSARKHLASLPGEVAGRLERPLAKPYRLMNIAMATAGETLPFLIAHEGEHIAHIKRLRKAVRQG